MTERPQRGEIDTLIQAAFTSMGGRATKANLQTKVAENLPEEHRDYLVGRGLADRIGTFFRSQDDDGLPVAPAVDDEGTHVQGELMSVEEFRYCVRSQASSSVRAKRQAQKYAQRCEDLHGVRINVAAELRAAGRREAKADQAEQAAS